MFVKEEKKKIAGLGGGGIAESVTTSLSSMAPRASTVRPTVRNGEEMQSLLRHKNKQKKKPS